MGQADLLRESSVDVVGLSCYTWNWHLNLQLAKRVKESHPNAIVAAGGPEPDIRDPDFFVKYPDIDVVVVKDGEVPFTRILDGLADGALDLAGIPGLFLAATSSSLPVADDTHRVGCPHLFTGTTELPAAFDHSPYRMQFDRLKGLIKDYEGQQIAATLETNRGCPYSCNYCDWGSATMSKVRQFDLARVREDITAIANLGVTWVFQADANFGILPRDPQIADLLVEARAQRGFPRSLVYSPAKNNPERTVEISRRLYEGGLIREHWLAVQHTDHDVLNTAERSNISAAKYREVAVSLRQAGVPCFPQLILGMPGDTLDRWKTCVTTMMEWGIHDHYWVSVYSLLPNAPAANPDFLRLWNVETIEREFVDAWGLRLKQGRPVLRSRIVVAFDGYTRNDWVDASTYTAHVRGLHNMAVVRLPAIYLHATHGIPYREIYDAVIEEFLARRAPWCHIHARVRAAYRQILEDTEAVDDYPLEEFPALPYYVNPSKGVFVDVVLRLDTFIKDVGTFLRSRFPEANEIDSVLEYQKQLTITPRCLSARRDRIVMRHDWPSYFAAVDGTDGTTPIPAPRRFLVPRTAMLPPLEADAPDVEGNPRLAWLKHVLSVPNTVTHSNRRQPKTGVSQITWPTFAGHRN